MYSFASQRGLSLIELMIGILLGSLLLLGVLQIFQSNSDTLRMQNGFSRVQESGRFAIDMLSKEVRQAGFWGCAVNAKLGNLLRTADKFYLDIGPKVNGIKGENNVVDGTKVDDRLVKVGSDTLTLSGAEDACAGEGRMLEGTNKGDVIVSKSCQIDAGDVVIVSNCIAADVFVVTAATGGGTADQTKLSYQKNVAIDGVENKSNTLQEEYGADSRILIPYQKKFFVSAGVTGNSLFVEDENGGVQELVPGVDDMQISFGVDTNTNGIVDRWQTAADVAGVTAIKIELLVASDSAVGIDQQTITRLDGSTTTYNDGLLRKLYVATIKVRNRGSM